MTFMLQDVVRNKSCTCEILGFADERYGGNLVPSCCLHTLLLDLHAVQMPETPFSM